MRKARFITMCFFILAVTLFVSQARSSAAHADTGPKPSVVIEFEGLENQTYYVTLLSLHKSTGPHSAYHPIYDARYDEDDNDYDIFLKFLSYEDSDGYYFLQFFGNCSDTHAFKWGYYPPTTFKVLVYFPLSDSFLVSESLSDYAFDSYFKVSVNDLAVSVGKIAPVKNYNYAGEILALIARIIITVTVEIGLALLFSLRKKRQLIFISIVNLITQILLNVFLNIIVYFNGWQMYLLVLYFFIEVAVFLIEGILYSIFLAKRTNAKNPSLFTTPPKNGEIHKRKAWLYAFTANAASFILGLWLASVLPVLF